MVGKFKIIWEPISDKSKVSIEMMIFYSAWFSTDDNFNCRLVHAFTCAGILPTQYLKFIEFDGIGGVGKRYIKTGH